MGLKNLNNRFVSFIGPNKKKESLKLFNFKFLKSALEAFQMALAMKNTKHKDYELLNIQKVKNSKRKLI